MTIRPKSPGGEGARATTSRSDTRASDRCIGIYKRLLSVRDQQIFPAVAGKEREEAGYKPDVEA